MKTKRAGLSTKLVLLILMLAVALALLSVRARLEQAQEQLDAVKLQVQAQTGINEALRQDIAQSDSAQNVADIAREKLDLVEPDEKVFVDTNH
jgi:cell division protein FtsL